MSGNDLVHRVIRSISTASKARILMVNKRLAAYEFTGVCGTRIGSRKKPAGVNRLQRYGRSRSAIWATSAERLVIAAGQRGATVGRESDRKLDAAPVGSPIRPAGAFKAGGSCRTIADGSRERLGA